MKALKEFWENSSPKKRKTVLAGAAVLALAGSAIIFDSDSGAGGPQRKLPEAARTNLSLPKVADKTPESLAAAQTAQGSEILRLKEELARSKSERDLLMTKFEQGGKREPDQVTLDLINLVDGLKKRLDEVEKAPKGGAPSLNDPLPDPEPAASAPAPEPARPKLRVSGAAKVVEKKAPQAEEKPVVYLPPGTFFEATLLNGMDAPTSSAAQKNPVPAVMRIKSDALLPNMFTHDIKECFILVSGHGVLSSHRAQLRTETISCVQEDGKVIESKADGYVVSEDGRVGPKGRVVTKQGQLIAQSLAAGTLGGFSQALKPRAVPALNLGSTGITQTERMSGRTLAESGVATGLSDASKAASAFFLDMAREMTPVIEIDAGRKLTVVLVKGLELK